MNEQLIKPATRMASEVEHTNGAPSPAEMADDFVNYGTASRTTQAVGYGGALDWAGFPKP